MPGYAGSLNDAQVAAVLSYMRARFTAEPAWADVAADVRRIREGKGS